MSTQENGQDRSFNARGPSDAILKYVGSAVAEPFNREPKAILVKAGPPDALVGPWLTIVVDGREPFIFHMAACST